jgi:hypothetical protein
VVTEGSFGIEEANGGRHCLACVLCGGFLLRALSLQFCGDTSFVLHTPLPLRQ